MATRKEGGTQDNQGSCQAAIVVEAMVVDLGQVLAVAEEAYRTNISSAENLARYLAALGLGHLVMRR